MNDMYPEEAWAERWMILIAWFFLWYFLAKWWWYA